MDKYIVTGNDMLSLPCIREADASIMDFTFLYMGFKGLIDVKGENTPFMQPVIKINGKRKTLKDLKWDKIAYWIPTFTYEDKDVIVKGTILTSVEDRGFTVRLETLNKTEKQIKVEMGFEGAWEKTYQAINSDYEIKGGKNMWYSWYDLPVFGLIESASLFAFTFMFDLGKQVDRKIDQAEDGSYNYSYTNTQAVEGGKTGILDIFFGFGFEAVAAITSALDLSRLTFENCLERTVDFLEERIQKTGDEELDRILNYNLFFSYFFAAGRTLDTEELVLCTSRSPRYYVSAAYWDRDSLLWSFPAMLYVDEDRAKESLYYVFGRQQNNFGVHSRYIDGTVLEPGFELDELCAPVIALYNYVVRTGDKDILTEDPRFERGVMSILNKLIKKKHKDIDLYETMLYPSDDMSTYPYLTYDNVLVEKVYNAVAYLFDGIWDKAVIKTMKCSADAVRQAIEDNLIMDYNGKKIYAWSSDLRGHYKLYDEPPGSLVLLTYFGHCDETNEVYKNTVERLYAKDYKYSFKGTKFAEIGCEHNEHPWILSYGNSLLLGKVKESVDKIKMMTMDNGIACESIHEDEGYSTSGDAFATCAGYLAYTLMYALIYNKK